ncbi:MAG: hypothetical protein JSR59_22015 [Proteobacteria bacterium]|nr:hypothetical protein [Pseudomonadota bacterium]
MIHPLLHLIATRPNLLAEHAEAYAELAAEEFGQVASAWKLRLALQVVGAGLVAVSAVLAGVAVMLWAVTPPSEMHAPWALVVAPLTPLVVALGCIARAGKPGDTSFVQLREQMRADLVMLRDVSAT